MSALFWLSDEQWAAIEPKLPQNQPGARRVDDRRVISGIFHVLKTGCRWCDCPAEYGPATTIYNRFNRWSRRLFWPGPTLGVWRKRGARTQAIGPSRGGQTTKIHALTDTIGRPFALALTPGNVSDITAAPALIARAKGVRHLLADKGYDADALRRQLRQNGAVPVIPGRANRKKPIPLDKGSCPKAWCRRLLKDQQPPQ